jgi:hypothetical protein
MRAFTVALSLGSGNLNTMRSAILRRVMASLLCAFALSSAARSGESEPTDPVPTPKDWEALAKLPDLSGIWVPDVKDQVQQEKTNEPPWTPLIAKQIEHLKAEESAGRPFPIIDHCFPTGMPSYMLITHNAFEFLLTPGRVTLLGEGDGNRLRRIYTDGRAHPADPDPSFHGHSIGHWEGDTLVVDTVAVLPQSFLAINEAVGVPNNGAMHIVERIHLRDADTLLDDLEIDAPKVLSKVWKTTRRYLRQRAQKFDIVEGVCAQGRFIDGIDKHGNATFAPVPFKYGVPVGPKSK